MYSSKMLFWEFGLPVNMETQVNMAQLLAQPHHNCNYITEQPSLGSIKNRLEWKSDNYGNKETTSIQTGRSGETEWSGPISMHGG